MFTRARLSTTRLVLVTKDGATAGDPNEFSTTGAAGTAVFPTGYLYETAKPSISHHHTFSQLHLRLDRGQHVLFIGGEVNNEIDELRRVTLVVV